MVRVIFALMLAMSVVFGMANSGTAMAAQASGDTEWQQEVAAREERQVRLDELLAIISSEMATIRATEDLQEREALMDVHRGHMLEAMELMQEMGSDQMQDVIAEHMASGLEQEARADHRARGPKTRSHRRPRAELSDAQRLADLEIRVDMMQVMIESLMMQ